MLLKKCIKNAAIVLMTGMLCLGGICVKQEVNAADSGMQQLEVLNTGFESGTTAPWTGKDGASVKAVAGGAKHGNYCMEISGRPATYAGAKADIGASLKNNQILEFTSYAKYTSGPDTKTIQVTLSSGGRFFNFASGKLKKNEWGEVKGSVIIPGDINTSDAFLYFETPWTGSPEAGNDFMNIYVDDARAAIRSFSDISDYPSLKELYKDEFMIGVASPNGVLTTKVYSDLIKQQFNSLTMENEMKPGYILDQNTSKRDLNRYRESAALNFNSCKTGLDYAKNNGLKMRGHTLVWHAQTPDWFFYENYDTGGALASKELMLKRMENYIKGVIEWTESNYPGVIYAWDVVNEAVADYFGAGPAGLRTEGSMWYKTIGDSFVEKAFEFARKYTKQYAPDRTIKLFYNDYNEYFPAKRDGIIKLLKPIKEAGNIDGVGMQSHINTDRPLEGDSGYITAVRKFSSELGLEIHCTEMDVVLGRGATMESQGQYLKSLFSALLREKRSGAKITCVTFWGLTDDLSWIDSKDCLLFLGDLSRKPAFEGIVDAINQAGSDTPGENLITNGSFEQDQEGWAPNEEAELGLGYTTVYDGSRSLKISGRTRTASGAIQDITGKVAKGRTYEVSAAVRYNLSENAQAAGNTTFHMSIFYGNNYVGNESIENMASVTTKADSWAIMRGTYTIPEYADLSRVRVFVETNFSSNPTAQDLVTFFVDGVSMRDIQGSGGDDGDQKAAKAVEGKIEAIGEVEYTEASRGKIEGAREAYEALSESQKKLVGNYKDLTQAEERYQELKAQAEQALADQKAAEAVKGKIEAIGGVEYTEASRVKIEGAREAYEALSESQKKLVGNYKDLTQAEERYQELKAQAEQALADQKAAEAVKGKIEAIGGVEYTEASRVKIEGAREAYEALSETQKKLVGNYRTLVEAEERYKELKAQAEQGLADQKAAEAVESKIKAIGEVEYTEASRGKIEGAREAYEALSETQKKLVGNYRTLAEAEERYKELKTQAEQVLADRKAAEAVEDKIKAIGEVEYTETSREKIEGAREAYEALSEAQRRLVENYPVLSEAEERYRELKAQAEQELADQKAAEAVEGKIEAIGEVEYTEASKAKIEEAREAFESLSDVQKELVENYSTLVEAEVRYEQYVNDEKTDREKAAAVQERISAIGTVEYTAESKGRIDAARTFYDDLTPIQKSMVINYDILTQAEDAYAVLKAQAEEDLRVAGEVQSLIASIGTVNYTQSCKESIEAARKAYNALSDVQKTLVSNISLLTGAENTYAILRARAEKEETDRNAARSVEAKIGKIGAVYLAEESSSRIREARGAYESLTPEQKALVGNYGVLTKAEARFEELKREHEKDNNDNQNIVRGGVYRNGNYSYKVTSTTKRTVTVVKSQKKNLKTLRVYDQVKLGGCSYKVTAVEGLAFKNHKKATYVVIGKNVKEIGNSAFAGCGKMKKLTINSRGLKKIGSKAFYKCKDLKRISIKSTALKSVGKRAFQGIYKKAVVKVPGRKRAGYRKLLRKNGLSNYAKVG